MLTNKGLVEHAQTALTQKWGYVWGTFGQLLTEALFNQLKKQYPEGVGGYESFIRSKWFGRNVSDCVGLIKSYYWSDSGKFKYDPATDISADTMFSRAKEKGDISTIPDIPGICVWKKGHIGIYVGNGEVIEAHGTKFGVIKTPLRGAGSTPWTNWLKCPYIKYVKEPVKPAAPQYPGYILRYNTGEADVNVKLVQQKLKITIDGLFGPKTLKAVQDFQKKNGLTADGEIGPSTWNKIFN